MVDSSTTDVDGGTSAAVGLNATVGFDYFVSFCNVLLASIASSIRCHKMASMAVGADFKVEPELIIAT